MRHGVFKRVILVSILTVMLAAWYLPGARQRSIGRRAGGGDVAFAAGNLRRRMLCPGRRQ